MDSFQIQTPVLQGEVEREAAQQRRTDPDGLEPPEWVMDNSGLEGYGSGLSYLATEKHPELRSIALEY
jgi:hypothetical protein